MARHIALIALVDLETDRRARGDHDVLLLHPAEDAAALFKARTAYLGWAEIDNMPTLAHGTWLSLTLHAAIFDASVDGVNFEEMKVSMDATARLWGCILAGGFVSPPEGSDLGALLNNITVAALKTPDQAARVIRVGDLDQNEMAQIPGDAALSVIPLPDVWDERVEALRRNLTYGDLVRPDRAGSTIAMLEAALGRRVLMTHRQPGSPFLGTLKAVVRAAHSVEALDDLTDEEVALTVGNAIRGAEWPILLRTFDPRVLARRSDLCKAIKCQGVPDAAAMLERLPAAIKSGEFEELAKLLEGSTRPPELQSFLVEAATLLKVEAAGGAATEALMRSVERELAGKVPSGDSVRARLDKLAGTLKERALADVVMPKGDLGKEGDKASSHSRLQADALHAVYATDNFIQQERALTRMDSAPGALFLALTSSFLSPTVGDPDGPESAEEAAQAIGWTPIPILHQLVWGKVNSLVGKEHLRKLASYRIYMPKLLGKLAARGLNGVDQPGKERLSTLLLEPLYEQLKARSWTSLDLINNLGLPLHAAFHDEQLDTQARVPADRIYTDVMRLLAVASPAAQVLQLCRVPLTGQGSVKHWLQAPLDVFLLHASGCTA